jgi:hypothetical protein
MSFVAGSAMTVLGAAGTARAQDAASLAANAAEARAAQAQADEARAHATDLAAQGGWAWKTGAIDRANAEAARYQAQADEARAVITGANRAPRVSPEMAEAQDRVDNLKAAGGWAYKTGAVSRAEADVAALAGGRPGAEGVPQEQDPATATKPVEKVQSEQPESPAP